VEERVCVYFSLVWFVYVVFHPALHKYTPIGRYSLYELKVPLNTKQANKQTKTSEPPRIDRLPVSSYWWPWVSLVLFPR